MIDLVDRDSLPDGTVLVASYKGSMYSLTVHVTADKKRVYELDGKTYGSPSHAARVVCGGTSVNGWRFWSKEGAVTVTKDSNGKVERKARAKRTNTFEDALARDNARLAMLSIERVRRMDENGTSLNPKCATCGERRQNHAIWRDPGKRACLVANVTCDNFNGPVRGTIAKPGPDPATTNGATVKRRAS